MKKISLCLVTNKEPLYDIMQKFGKPNIFYQIQIRFENDSKEVLLGDIST